MEGTEGCSIRGNNTDPGSRYVLMSDQTDALPRHVDSLFSHFNFFFIHFIFMSASF